MAKADPKWHVQAGGETLCGSRSVVARWRVADCEKCRSRMDDLLGLILDAAAGQDVTERAVLLARRLGLEAAADGR